MFFCSNLSPCIITKYRLSFLTIYPRNGCEDSRSCCIQLNEHIKINFILFYTYIHYYTKTRKDTQTKFYKIRRFTLCVRHWELGTNPKMTQALEMNLMFYVKKNADYWLKYGTTLNVKNYKFVTTIFRCGRERNNWLYHLERMMVYCPFKFSKGMGRDILEDRGSNVFVGIDKIIV